MGKASSAKKVARAARAGGSRRPGQRRALGFPLLVGAIILSGTLLVAFARDNREAGAAPRSQANEDFDHWHAAYGVYDCGEFIFNSEGNFIVDAAGDPLGIHTHGDGVIHIHPFTDASGGRNARMELFFQDVAIDASDSKWTFPDGTVWDESTKTCGEEPGQIVIAKWNDAQAAADGERPNELITEDFGDIRFRNDREYYTFAFVPESALDEIPVRPDIVANLNNLSDVPPDQNIEAPSSTDTTATTAPGDTSTTAPGGTTATTAPTTATTTSG